MFFSKQKLRSFTENVDSVRWSGRDGKIAICTANLIHVLSPLALPTIERDTVVRPLSDSFEFTVAYLPKQLDSTLKYEIPPVSVNDLYKDPFTEGPSNILKALDPIYTPGVGTFVVCEWIPICGLDSSLLCGLTSTGRLLIFTPPIAPSRTWNVAYNLCNDLISHIALCLPTESAKVDDSVGDSVMEDGESSQQSDSIGDVGDSERVDGDESGIGDGDHSNKGKVVSDKAYYTVEGQIVMPSFSQYERALKYSAISAFAWQEDSELGASSAWIAIGNRTQNIIVITVTLKHFSSEDSKTSIDSTVKWLHQLDIPTKANISCIRWKRDTRNSSGDACFAVGTSFGTIHVISSKESDGSNFDVVALIDSVSTDFIPVGHFLWSHQGVKVPGGEDAMESILLFSKGQHIGAGRIGNESWNMSDVAYATGIHSLPVSGMAEMCGSRVVSVSLDGSAQSFDPWSSNARAAGVNFHVLETTRIQLPLNMDGPPSMHLRGVASSPNGIFTCFVVNFGNISLDKKTKSEIQFFSNISAEEGLSLVKSDLATLSTDIYDVLHLLAVSEVADQSLYTELLGNVSDEVPLNLLKKIYQIAIVFGSVEQRNSVEEVILKRHVTTQVEEWLGSADSTLCDRGLQALSAMSQWLKAHPEGGKLADKVLANLSSVHDSRCCVCACDVTPSSYTEMLGRGRTCRNGHRIGGPSIVFAQSVTHALKNCVH
jgi:hypothetical protein